MVMSSKTSSKVKSSSVLEPSVLLAVTPAMLHDIQLIMPTRTWLDWGSVSSSSLDVHGDLARLPSRSKNLKVMVVSDQSPERRSAIASPFSPPAGEDMLSADAMATMMNCTRANVYEREKKGSLFSVLPPGRENGRKYPAFQIHRNVDTRLLVALIALYRDRAVSMNYLWDFLRSVQSAFGGATGVEVLKGEHPQRSGINKPVLSALQALTPAERHRFVMDHALEDLHHASA
jgi:hypothetical protein